jgi:hypothetical protein
MTRDTEMYEVARTLKVNDVIEYRLIMRSPPIDEVRSARIAEITVRDDREQVDITYVSCSRPNTVQCGFGCTFIAPAPNSSHAAGKWGWQWIKKVGEEKSRTTPTPPNLYKNPGYDLVNM